jgi:hypothetical protein
MDRRKLRKKTVESGRTVTLTVSQLHQVLIGFSDLNKTCVEQSGFYGFHFTSCVHGQVPFALRNIKTQLRTWVYTKMADVPVLSSEKMLHKDYDSKGSIEKKKSLVVILKGPGTKTNWMTLNRQS